MVLGCPVFEQCPLPFWVPHACHAMNSVALPSCLLFVLLRALMFYLTSRCVFVFVHLSVCFFVARSILFVARVRLHIPCVGSRLDSWPEVLHWLDLLAPLFVDEYFRCADSSAVCRPRPDASLFVLPSSCCCVLSLIVTQSQCFSLVNLCVF